MNAMCPRYYAQGAKENDNDTIPLDQQLDKKKRNPVLATKSTAWHGMLFKIRQPAGVDIVTKQLKMARQQIPSITDYAHVKQQLKLFK
jgi:hypothetical protein